MNEFEFEQERSRAEVASYLRQIADGLENDEKVTLVFGEQSVAMNPPGMVHFRINTDTDSSWLGSENGRSINIELGWEQSDVETDDELTIVQQGSRSQGTDPVDRADAHSDTTTGDRTTDDRTTDR